MPPSHARHHLSSGDLVADRRLEMARDYALGGEPAAAAELVAQALDLVPDWAAGWFALGEFREAASARAGDAATEAGDAGPGAPVDPRRDGGGRGAAEATSPADAAAFRDGAIAAYREALRLDEADRCGATLRLARLGAAPAPDAPPAAHVRDLFDGYAERYEASLVTALGYRGPELIGRMLDGHAAGRRFATAFDLGCGTGLVAPVIRGRVDRLDGVDLAPAMIAKARAGGLYDGLEVGEVVAAMEARAPRSIDLVTAGDVFCYLGDLTPVFAAVARVAVAGAVFVFTTEAVADDEPGADVVLRDSLRWAHRRRHLEEAARAAGFEVTAIEAAVLRRDRGADIAGHVALLTRS